MIQQMSFLGIPLRTQHQRRMLVIGYYLLIAISAALGLWHATGKLPGFLLPQIFVLGSLLGGLTVDRPVKPYTAKAQGGVYDSTITLNLSGRKSFALREPLDEREQGQRDHAHFVAYRVLIVSLMFAVCAYFVVYTFESDLHKDWLAFRTPMLLWTMMVYAISLPQSVLLWTEPSEPMAEVIPMPSV